MITKINNIVSKIGASVVDNFPFFVILILLLALPAGYGAFGNERYFQPVLFLTATVQAITLSTFLACLFNDSSPLKKIGRVIIFTIFLSLFLTESFVYSNFYSRVSVLIVSLIMQTDPIEAELFIKTYLFSSKSLYGVIGLIVLLFFLFFLDRAWKNKLNEKLIRFRKFIGYACCLFSLFGIILFAWNIKSKYSAPVGLDTIQNLVYSFNHLENRQESYEAIYKNNENVEITFVDEKSPIIVLVIGESFIKYHSSLYGYALETNPLLRKEETEGNLFKYNDVISTGMWTAYVMQSVFSLKTQDDNDINKYPLFPAVFRKANYKVAYIDNQITRATGKRDYDYGAVWFFNPANINRQCFDFRNERTWRLDGDAITACANDLFHEDKSLNIIHLRGQHVPQSADYPDTGWDRFSIADINRNDLDDKKKQSVVEYDNATYYNDAVVKQIIDLFRNDDVVVVYFSDHGEQVYDDSRLKIARKATDTMLEDIKPLYEIPFIIWVSDKFKDKHP